MHFEDEAKPIVDTYSLKRYWRFILPLVFILVLMVKFPLRIALSESFADAMFYGTISLICLAIGIRIYQRFHKRGYRLVVVTLLCSALSGWQIVDMTILRLEGSSAHEYSASAGVFEPLHIGWAWYNLRFPNPNIVCHTLYEQYIGNNFIAIAFDIDRNATWFACGG